MNQLPSSPVKEKDEVPVSWLNALIGRIAWDFFREQHWSEWVSKKIQMKLSKIRVSISLVVSDLLLVS